MIQILLIVHILICVALVALILMQRSEGGVLGVGGGGGGGMFTARGATDLLTRGTTILGVAFFVTSITLTLLSGGGAPRSVLDTTPAEAPAPVTAPLLAPEPTTNAPTPEAPTETPAETPTS